MIVRTQTLSLATRLLEIGIVEDPLQFGSSTILTSDKASALGALRLTGTGYSSATFTSDSYFTQTVSTGTTAVGRVISYDQTTGVLKFWQDRSLAGFNTVGTAQTQPTYGFELQEFTCFSWNRWISDYHPKFGQ